MRLERRSAGARAARAVGAAGWAAALVLLTAGCGAGDGESAAADPDRGAHAEAADTGTCVAEAKPVGSTPEGFPADFPFPRGTVIYHVEDRGPDGIIASGVTATPFEDVLAAMNAAEKSGFEVTSGETEDDDAEAEWQGNGYDGRWAIQKSSACPGETVIQLLARAQ